MLQLEALCVDTLHHRVLLADRARDESLAERNELLLRRPLGVLNKTLDGRRHLLSDDFGVADLNVSVILEWALRAGMDFSFVPEVDRWLQTCLARPAFDRVRNMQSSR
jgi:glutathione S-transferase